MNENNLHNIIKNTAEDFIVDEIPLDFQKKPDGKYTIIKVRLTNWDTNRFVSVLARSLRISRKRITFAGTKDKKGITTQYFCINGAYSNELETLKDCEVMEVFRTDNMLRMGDLKGNKFSIRLNLEEVEDDHILNTNRSIVAGGGYWNLYGEQRFGTNRSNTHRIGEQIIRGNFEAAAKLYLYDPEFDSDGYRLDLSRDWNYKAALDNYPEYLGFERAILSHLASGGSFEESLDVLPKTLEIMFVHAFQSMLFNRMLKMRAEYSDSPDKVYVGDFVQQKDSYFNVSGELIEVTSFNYDKISKLSLENKVTAVMPLAGYETRLQSGIPGEIVEKTMKEFNVTREMFRIHKNEKLSSSGNYRGVRFIPIGFSCTNKWLNFSLGKGMYATTLIDQILENIKNR